MQTLKIYPPPRLPKLLSDLGWRFCCYLFIAFCSVVLTALYGLAIILLMSGGLTVAGCLLCLFLTVPWVALWFVIVAFLGHTNLLFDYIIDTKMKI